MLSREDKKNQTRKSLMNAALQLVDEGQNFASISLREVAKNAGVVPTSFYRHFRDMEELGLNIIDELGLMLRKQLRSSRQQPRFDAEGTYATVGVFTEFVWSNTSYFSFLSQVRGGGTTALRNAIRNELRHFAHELATDLRALPNNAQVSASDLECTSELLVSILADSVIDLLDLKDSRPDYRDLCIGRLASKLGIVYRGLQVLSEAV